MTEAINIQYVIVEEKHLSNNIFQGRLLQLSKKGAKVQVESLTKDSILPAFTNLKINLLINNNSEISDDIYAKVTKKSSEVGMFYIYFTSKIPALQEKIDIAFSSDSGKI